MANTADIIRSLDIPLDAIARHFDRAPRSKGPDFLCIGQQKAGTKWLYDVLQFENGIWMPPIKELHFLDGRFRRDKAEALYAELRNHPLRTNRRRLRHKQRALDRADLRFLRHAVSYDPDICGLEWYVDLFDAKGDCVAGDITPGYSALEGESIGRLAHRLPNLKVVLLLREPVSRAWSAVNMKLRHRIMGRGAQQREPERLDDFYGTPLTVEGVKEIVNGPGFAKRSRPSDIFARWSRHFDRQQIHIDFFDQILADPPAVREACLDFIGIPAEGRLHDNEMVDFNRKSDKAKREMPPEVCDYLVGHFRDELFRCAEIFGGPAAEWPKRYGL